MGIKVKTPLLDTIVKENGKIISARYDYGDLSIVEPDSYVVTYSWLTRIKNSHQFYTKLLYFDK